MELKKYTVLTPRTWCDYSTIEEIYQDTKPYAKDSDMEEEIILLIQERQVKSVTNVETLLTYCEKNSNR